MSGHFELEPNQKPDMKRKIVVVGDGAPCLLLDLELRRDLSPRVVDRRVWEDVPFNRVRA
jgi:hypothetical protein